MSQVLLRGEAEGICWKLTLHLSEPEFYWSENTKFRLVNVSAKKKSWIRTEDRLWCYRNIPSSIMWHSQIHHDWSNNGTMYLLSTKKEVKE